MSDAELERLWRRLQPLAVDQIPWQPHRLATAASAAPWPWSGCTGRAPRWWSRCATGTWTADGLLRHVTYLGEREDKPAREVVREPPAVGG